MSQLKLIRDLIADDSYASTFQTMGQYRTALLKNADSLIRTASESMVAERVPMDRFENAIREVGVVAACEWFGHSHDSEFTKDTMQVLAERLAIAQGAAA